MVLQPSGSNQTLVSIETPVLYLTIKGKQIDFGDYKNEYYVICEDDIIENYRISKGPIFFEYTDYELVIEKKRDDDKIEFFHENIQIRKQITYTSKSKKILSGIINFGGDIGLTKIMIKLNNQHYLTVILEVFPSKIDYNEDYLHILQDINEEIYNLSFDFLKKTYLKATITDKSNNSLTEFFSILQVIYFKLLKAINLISKYPHHQLIQNEEIKPFNKLKKENNKTIKWLEKNQHYLIKINEKYIPIKALQINKRVTLDTYENQFIKHILLSIKNRLEDLKRKYFLLKREKDHLFVNKIDDMLMELNKNLNNSFWTKISSFQPKESFSLVIKMAPGYKEIYKYYLILKKGLKLQGEIFNLSVKDLALLYEYWCFIKINSLLRKKYKLIKSDLIQINTDGIFITLKKGRNTSVKYLNPKTGETFVVSYNLGMKSLTVGQKPDNIFSIKKTGSSTEYNYIFDAKYRINNAQPGSYYQKYYKLPGPEEDDINTMHRYRDAIVLADSEKAKRNVFGAFVLFPYKKEEEYKEHPFYKSIQLVNIGGIPFLPTATKLLENFLDELINESHYSAFERSIHQVGIDDYLKEEYFSNRNVLVGTLRNKKQLDINLKYNFYHTKLSNVNLHKNKPRFVAIYQSSNLFNERSKIEYFGEIKNIEILPRSEIKELPLSNKNNELYIKFQIEKWERLSRPIKIKGHSIRTIMYTTEYLLKNCEYSEELCIKDEIQFRIWMELKRWVKEVEISFKEDKININGFKIEDKSIGLFNREIYIIRNDKLIRKISLKEFRNNPGRVVKEILTT